VDLKELCRERGEPVSGTKAVLISRLLAHAFKDSPASKKEASETHSASAESQIAQEQIPALIMNDEADQMEANRGTQQQESVELNSRGEQGKYMYMNVDIAVGIGAYSCTYSCHGSRPIILNTNILSTNFKGRIDLCLHLYMHVCEQAVIFHAGKNMLYPSLSKTCSFYWL
jgi:hypothetical protein